MRYRPRLATIGLLWLLVGGACGDSNQDVAPSTASADSTTSTSEIETETIRFAVLDGTVVQVEAPPGIIAAGATTHTTVSMGDLVLLVETGGRAFGEGLLAEMVKSEPEQYRGGELTNGALTTGPNGLVWLGNPHSLFLPYDRVFYHYEDVRNLLDSLDIVETAAGVIGRPGMVEMHGSTVSVSLIGGGGLDIEPFDGPDQKRIKVDRGPSNEVTSIEVTYPTAKVVVYMPPFRDGAAFVELMELIEIDWS